MSVEALLDDPVVDALAAASERGVSVKLAGLSDSVGDAIADEVDDVDLFESIWDWSDTPAGRLLLVDQERTPASVLVETDGPPAREETAIWGSGETNGLVVVLRAMFTW